MAAVSTALVLLLLASVPQGVADIEQEAKQLEQELIAPCCFRQQVSVHSSPAADELRRDIRVRLADGESRQAILDAYVAQYGKRVLAQPPAEGLARTLYVAPVVAAAIGSAMLVAILRRLTRRRPRREGARDGSAGAPAEEDRLDEELRALD